MSLQGSLETFALPDVLVLLASTKKDGELRVAGGSIDGRVWLDKGQIVHTSISGTATKALDGVFELLRLESGSFTFDGAGEPPQRSGPDTVDRVLAGAQARLIEWNEIVLVVPHVDVVVDMAPEAPGDEVTITKAQWRLVRAVAGGRTVRSLMSDLGAGEFDTCRTVKELVEAKLVTVDLTPKCKEPKAAEQPAPEPAPAATAEEPPAPARPRREPSAAAAATAALQAAGAAALDERNGFDRGA
ncbi:MAG TPA: DUF4388 domain-containing protein, partial [Acidimicrobiales bacterium]|nr:DUF4388 domain-containing protein [Acidimicrobiales bacterium]